jgi:hypothetical protein
MFSRVVLTALTCFILCINSTFAADFVVPQQRIIGAEAPIPLGELVDLTISPIKDPPKHFTSYSVAWKIFDGDKEKRVREYQDGIFFGAGVVPKKMTALVAVTYLFTVKEADRITEVATKTVLLSSPVIIGDTLDPEPTPVTPEPTFPESRYNLGSKTYKAAMAKVPASARKSGAAGIAKSFESIASAVAAGALTQVDDVLKKTTEANRVAVGDKRADWEPFFKYMQDVLYTLYEEKQMVNSSDFAEAWREVAAGLKAIK